MPEILKNTTIDPFDTSKYQHGKQNHKEQRMTCKLYKGLRLKERIKALSETQNIPERYFIADLRVKYCEIFPAGDRSFVKHMDGLTGLKGDISLSEMMFFSEELNCSINDLLIPVWND